MYISILSDAIWIGIEQIGSEWIYYDGRNATFINWEAPGPNPADMCAYLEIGEYFSAPCGASNGASCQKPLCGRILKRIYFINILHSIT